MLVIPAVDIRGGKAVRLLHGEPDKQTVYFGDPLEPALMFQAAGAARLHVVDLDGAFSGTMKNAGIIEKIVRSLDIPVQVGGGIRGEEEAADLLARGVDRVILGTAAVTEPGLVARLCARFPGRILAGIDARSGLVAIRGWVETSALGAVELARAMSGHGVKEIVYTDISRDGALTGPNLAALREMAQAVDAGVIASGGVSTISDIEALLELEPYGVTAVIVGRAVYAGKIDLAEAIKIAEGRK